MTTERVREMPAAFIEWVKANYSFWDAARITQDRNWQTGNVYQYWESNIAPTDPMYQGERLETALGNLVAEGSISAKDAGNYYLDVVNSGNWDKIAYFEYYGRPDAYLDYLGATPEVKQYLQSYTSKQDLADRIAALNVGDDIKASVYDSILYGSTGTDMALRGAQGRVQAGQQEAEEIRKGNIATLKKRQEDLLQGVANQRLIDKKRGEEQAGRALVGGFGLPYKGEKPKTERAVDYSGMPSASDILNKYVEGTGLAPGSKLRSFLEGQLYDTASNIQASRKEWWEKVNAPEDLPESYPEAVNRLTQAAEKWDRIAAGAPSSTYTSDTYWGVGGLAKMATDAAARHRQQASSIKPEDYWQGNIPERNVGEDPLLRSLRGKTKKKLEADFFRLSPSARGYSSRRFAPSVRF